MNRSMLPQKYTAKEKRLKGFLDFLVILYGLAIFVYFLPGVIGLPPGLSRIRFISDPAFVNNSVIKIGLCFLICIIGVADVRRFRPVIQFFIIGNAISVITGALLYFYARDNYIIVLFGHNTTIRSILPYSVLLDGCIMIVLWRLHRGAQRSYYGLAYLTPAQYRTLTALAEVVIRSDNKEAVIPAEDIARNVDEYLARFEAKTKWITRLALTALNIYPVVNFKPPLTMMFKEERLSFLKRRFYRDVQFSLAPAWLAVYLQAMIRMGKQLCFMGYYNDPRVFDSIGYQVFSKRPQYRERVKESPDPRKPLQVMTESTVYTDEISAEIVIIGSGAGASILAHGLVNEGRHVLLVERGNYEDPQTFTENEMEMISRLYADGALQLSRDFRFQVIQGSCVGGSTVVNNAVCFDTPDAVLDRWCGSELDSGIDRQRFRECQREVNLLVGVRHGDPMALPSRLNPGGKLFIDGCARLGLDIPPDQATSVSANIKNCLGCGYCNIGCAYGKKLSMLTTILPETQANTKGKLDILAGCEVIRLKGSGPTITQAIGRFADGRKIVIKGNKFVVSAGAVSSSILLLNSAIAVSTAGKRLCFNMGSPMSAKFPQVIDSYAGLQISHYLELSPNRGYVYETWYNPPMFQAVAMPGWFEDHYENMLNYNRTTCVGVLVGTESNASVHTTGLTGREIRYVPTPGDYAKMIEALTLAGRIFLEAGAEFVMPDTFGYYKFDKSNIDKFGLTIKGPGDLSLGTGHPQGGNVMSRNPAIGTVNEEMKVYGYNNLYVADASVIPSALGVNPQITTMTFGKYAVEFIK
ncbi:MAG TPA: GMC family oxidoreductase N-terminal domain-containing protein [Puia sp.]|nr:GMC family oxidoreductase N-terminal domain-containing protein [Puia sp.]